MRTRLLFALLTFVAAAVALDGARYLIITTDALAASIRPFAEWKRATGLETKVVTLSEIGADTTSIKNYIRNAYATWPIRPEYVLLVGSPTALPARVYTGQVNYATDNIYSDMTGDLRSELAVGRFPAKSSTQLEVMIAKTLSYEVKPDLSNPYWMLGLTTVVNDYNDSDWPTYWADARMAAELAGQAGFMDCDSLSSQRGHTASDVVSCISDGTGLVLYRGTAGGNWKSPFTVNPALTTNGKMLPIIVSVTCETMTLYPYDSMVGEAWLKAGSVGNLKGAVAFFGNTHSASSVAQVRSAVARGFFTGLFVENIYKLGKATMRAREQLYAEYPNKTSDYRGFNLLGDPDLSIWTKTPKPLQVDQPFEISAAPQWLLINVACDSEPVGGATVCASMKSSVYAHDTTDAAGQAMLYVAPTDTGEMRLVITGQNLIPYDGTIRVVPLSALNSERSQPTGPIRLSALPAVFSQTVRLVLSGLPQAGSLLQIRDAAGRPVRTLVPTPDATWDGRDDAGRPLVAGVYFCRLLDPHGTCRAAVRLTLLN